MQSKDEVLRAVRSALMSVPRIDLQRDSITMDFDAGTVTLDGEVISVAAKKLALEAVAAVSQVSGIIDRLRVRPAQAMGDGQIRDLLRGALAEEPALAEVNLFEQVKGTLQTVRNLAERARGEIRINVEDGVVTLDGEVPGLAHKRLAGVLAWWVPGSRDVINGLGVEPPVTDNDMDITDAVRMALEKDPFIDAGRIRAATHDAVVVLRGLVPSDAERDMAEADAWYVFGVDGVANEIEVRPVPAAVG